MFLDHEQSALIESALATSGGFVNLLADGNSKHWLSFVHNFNDDPRAGVAMTDWRDGFDCTTFQSR